MLPSSSKENKEAVLLEIYNNNYRDLYNYGMRIARNDEITRDCIHDLFVQFWSRAEFDKIIDPKPYLFKSFRYIILDALRKNKTSFSTDDSFPEVMLSAEDILINKELDLQTSANIKSAITTLTNRQREVIYLRFYNGMNYNEISEITGINNQSVRNLLSAALKELRENMVPILLISSALQI